MTLSQEKEPVSTGTQTFPDNCQWITCSIFSSMALWPAVFKEIHQFIKKFSQQILCFHIGINYWNGENIRVALLTSSTNKQVIGYQLGLRFKSLLKEISDSSTKKIKGIFLPYPTNVVEFGLYNLDYDLSLLPEYEIQKRISGIIVEALQVEEIDFESIISFCFYLEICLAKAVLGHIKGKTDFVENISWDGKPNITNTSNANIDVLREITTDIMTDKDFKNESVWISQWMEICIYTIHEFLNQSGSLNDFQNDLQAFYRDFVLRIRSLLGISGKAENFLQYAVRHSLLDYFKGKNFRVSEL